MMGVVARYADEWNMWSLPDAFAERSGALDAACAAIGRDPATIARSCQALWFLADDQAKIDALIERGRAAPGRRRTGRAADRGRAGLGRRRRRRGHRPRLHARHAAPSGSSAST